MTVTLLFLTLNTIIAEASGWRPTEESLLVFEVGSLFNRDFEYRSGVGNLHATTPSFFVWAAAKKRVEYNFPFSVACAADASV